MEVLYIIKSSSADICSGTPCNKASNEDLCRFDAPVQWWDSEKGYEKRAIGTSALD